MLSDAVAILGAANCFPATHQVQALLEMFQLEGVFSARDVNARFMTILGRSEALVGAVGVEAAECNDAFAPTLDFTDSPSVLITRATYRLLATVTAIESSRAVRVVLGFPVSSTDLEFSCTVSRWETRNTVQQGGVNDTIQGLLTCIRTVEELFSSLEPKSLWDSADTGVELHLAVVLAVAKRQRIALTRLPSEAIPMSSIGSEFFDSCLRNEGASGGRFSGSILKKCTLVLSEGFAGADSFEKTRTADAARAFRVHVTKHHEGLRLMYWKRPTGEIEFANIGPKHELLIQEGDLKARSIARA